MSTELNDPAATSPVLVGRDAELRLIHRLLTGSASAGSALMIRGEPGAGRTSLLAAAADLAVEAGMATARVCGVPSEQRFPYAGLHRVLRPWLGRRSRLAPGHRAALEAAFGHAYRPGRLAHVNEVQPAGRFVVALAALELLSGVAAERALLLTVDDAQWLDDATVEVLAFVSRRIASERLVLLLASREPAPEVPELGATQELLLAPLSEQLAQELLAGAGLGPAETAYVLRAACGNPLALRELAQEVPRMGALPDEADVPRSGRLEASFAAGVLDLPRPARLLMLALAVQGTGSPADARAVAAAAAGTAIDVRILAEAVRAGLVTMGPDAIAFRHPLVRSAVLRRLGQAEVSVAHRSWAAALENTDPDQAVWHRAAAADRPDEVLAAQLESAADRVLAGGTLSVAQRWLERSAALTSERGLRQGRLLRAAEIGYERGRFDDVQRLLERAREERISDGQRHRLEWLVGIFDDAPGAGVAGVASLVDGASRAHAHGDTDLALQLLMGAARRCWWGDVSMPRVHRVAQRLDVPASDPRRLFIDATAATFATAGDVWRKLSHWAVAPPTDPAHCVLLATAAFNVADFDLALRFADRAVVPLRAQARLSLLAQLLVHRAWAAIFLGKWDLACDAAAEAFSAAVQSSQPMWAARARLAQADVEGRLGRTGTASVLLEDAERLAALSGRPSALSGVEFTRGIIELGRQRPVEAFGHLLSGLDRCGAAGDRVERLWLVDYVTEAASQSGHLAEAKALVDEVQDVVGRAASPGFSRALRLAQVHLADDDEVEERVVCARAVPGPPSVWYSARLDLAWGMALRRRRSIIESRRPLRRARVAFDAVGASAWAERARIELAAAGAAPGRPARTGWVDLSPQELQIARLAAEGLTNREIGSRLYLSHRTVGSHLYRIFPKVGIRSRAQLHHVLPVASTLTEQAGPEIAVT